jgi:hypothetical protein
MRVVTVEVVFWAKKEGVPLTEASFTPVERAKEPQHVG